MKKFSYLVACLALFGLALFVAMPMPADNTQQVPNVPAIVTTQVHDADTNDGVLSTRSPPNLDQNSSVVPAFSGTSEVVSPARLSPAVWRGDNANTATFGDRNRKSIDSRLMALDLESNTDESSNALLSALGITLDADD